jgi:ABC-type multidrug transport system ATPase subunit
LTQRLGGETVLSDISFAVEPGKLLVLYGASGAGKTALVSVLAGLRGCDSGKVEIFGLPVGGKNNGYKRHVGLVTQACSLFPNFTVKENLEVTGMLRGISSPVLAGRVAEAVERFQLGEVRRRRASTLPRGYRQRLAVACALLPEPDLLLGDDVLSGEEDAASAAVIRENLSQYLKGGNTCILTTARVEIVRMLTGAPGGAAGQCGAIGVLNQGGLSIGAPGDWEYNREESGRSGICQA